jgi:hypothetical protein
MLNQTVITGNLGDDPKIFYSPEGDPVTSFDLAFQAAKKKTCWTPSTLVCVRARYWILSGPRWILTGKQLPFSNRRTNVLTPCL